ncbi:MAG TPA: carboxypeptidase-like regulatory domain-containing protein [Gemmatimonadales bacterium]
MPPVPRPDFVSLAGLALMLLSARPLAAQARSEIVGTVVSDSGMVPLAGARVTITRPSGADTVLVADARGKFTLRRLSAGQYWVVASYRGIASPMLAIELRAGERFEAEFTVRQEAPDLGRPDSVAVLPDLEARAVSGRASTFEQRMATGLGIYLTQDQIERRESAGLNDVLRNVQGVRINCGRDGCFPVIARAQPGCVPDYYIDDMRADARMIENLRSTELRGIEIYQGLSQLPPELARDRSRARCGVIAVWTRRGPEPPPKPPQ